VLEVPCGSEKAGLMDAEQENEKKRRKRRRRRKG
jgi:hypothetical protein